ncbi:hypothetical protein ACTXG5_22845 [Mycobacterium sp. Dal123C01]|uniref:hypothetical protein n=1 Tax=Mycobacterium sp. Dal123C01 TaxID=3457577 RepID=UPI00403E41D8
MTSPPPGPIAIYDVKISDAINAKINAKQPGLTRFEVWEVCYSRDHNARWNYDPNNGGWRLIVKGRTVDNRLLRAILHPVDVEQGKWALKTAIAEDR